MKTRYFFLLICSMLCIAIILSACSKEEKEPNNPEDNWWWGYFDGTFTGTSPADDMTVSFVNDPVRPRFSSGISPEGIGNQDDVLTQAMSIQYIQVYDATPSYIQLSIRDIIPGTRFITHGDSFVIEDEMRYVSAIKVVRRYTLDPTAIVEFVPHEDNPFRLEITRVEWLPSSNDHPITEAKLDGTLYNKDNPQQSIEIHAVYGSR